MKIRELGSLPAGQTVDADVVIIGGGMAGLTLATELRGAGVRILILESGILGLDDRYQELNRVECIGDDHFDPHSAFRRKYHGANCPVWDPEIEPYGMRLRAFGGSSAYWGGKVTTFDAVDFTAREWAPGTGWPISREELAPYFDRVTPYLNLGPNIYDDRLWPLLGKAPFEPAIDPAKLRTTFWQFARSRVDKLDMVRFGKEYLEVDNPDTDVLIDATVTRIDLTDDLTAFKGVEASTYDGQRFYVTARTCVVAASAIENARLLLASNHQHADGLGNQGDVVGRYLMDHPGALLGSVPAREASPLLRRFGFFGLRQKLQTHMYMHGLALAEGVQHSEGLLNTAMFMLEDVSVDDPFKAAVRLAKLKRGSIWRDLWSVVSGIGLLAKGVGMKIFQSNYMPERLKDIIINTAIAVNPNMVVREYQSINMPHKLAAYDIHGICEHAPNRDSRVTLATSTDRFGVPRASIDWKVGVLEAKSLMRAARTLRDEFARIGLPAPKLVDWIEREEPETARLIDMAHSMGTTRMSTDPMTGVVDTDCRVHGVEGLYVAGGSVFPTSGHANPTLMILSLAVRLADHLKTARLGAGQVLEAGKASR